MQAAHKKNFHKYYQEKISKEIQNLEKLRQKQNIKHKLAQIILVFSIILFVPLYFYVQNSDLSSDPLVLGVYGTIIAIFLFVGPFYYLEPRNFTKKLNSALIKVFLDFFGGFIFLQKKGIHKKVLEKSMLFDDFKKITYQYDFKKDYLGMEVEINELELENKDKEDVFQGVVAQIQLKKSFFSETVITEHKFNQNGFVAKAASAMQKINIEVPNFATTFDLYSKSEVEAKIIARATVLEQLKQLKNAYKSSDIRAYFAQNSVIIAIPSIREKLEFGELQTTITDYGKLEKLFAEFVEVLAMTDVLRA